MGSDGFWADMIGCGSAILGALTASLALVYIRKLSGPGRVKMHWTVQTFWFMFGLLLFNPAWQYLVFSDKFADYSVELFVWTCVMAMIFVAQQSLFVAALGFVDAGSVAVINYL